MAVFLEHINQVLAKLREPSITALSTDRDSAAFNTQMAVQRAIARVWNAKSWTFKQRRTTLSVSSGSERVKLPKDVGEPYTILSSLYPYLLRPKTEDEFDRREPNPTATGNPRIYTLFHYDGVDTQPTSASTLSVASSSAADTTQTVLIRGQVSGQDDYESVSLSGTSTVTTSKSFTRVDSVSKSGTTT